MIHYFLKLLAATLIFLSGKNHMQCWLKGAIILSFVQNQKSYAEPGFRECTNKVVSYSWL